jgi:hypothetical protein
MLAASNLLDVEVSKVPSYSPLTAAIAIQAAYLTRYFWWYNTAIPIQAAYFTRY